MSCGGNGVLCRDCQPYAQEIAAFSADALRAVIVLPPTHTRVQVLYSPLTNVTAGDVVLYAVHANPRRGNDFLVRGRLAALAYNGGNGAAQTFEVPPGAKLEALGSGLTFAGSGTAYVTAVSWPDQACSCGGGHG